MNKTKETNEGVLGAIAGGGVGGAPGGPVGAVGGMAAGHLLQKKLKDRKKKKATEKAVAARIGESVWNTYKTIGVLIAEGLLGAKPVKSKLRKHRPKALIARIKRKIGPEGRKEAKEVMKAS